MIRKDQPQQFNCLHCIPSLAIKINILSLSTKTQFTDHVNLFIDRMHALWSAQILYSKVNCVQPLSPWKYSHWFDAIK